MRRWAEWLGISPAVAYALATRGWQFAAGPVTALLIAICFSGSQQGYYYTFWGLIELQIFFELGFWATIIHVASHEWSKLQLNSRGEIEGDAASRARLVSFGRSIFLWYGAASCAFTVLVGLGGGWFLAQEGDPGFAWKGPWLTLCVVNGLLLWVFPFSALLEGCNQVAAVHRLAVVQAITGNLAVWACMLLGGGLWTAVVAAGVRLFWYLFLVGVQYRGFFRPFFRPTPGVGMDWRSEVWPMQWRAALQSVFGYFSTWMFTPLMFAYHDPTVAGRMGMTWSIVIAVQRGALAWVQTRAPRFGMLAASGDRSTLDREFFRLTFLSAVVFCTASLVFLGGVVLLNFSELALKGRPLADRMLGPTATALLLVGTLLMLLNICLIIYARSHKEDPFLGASILSSCVIGLAVWILGSSGLAAEGVGLGYAISAAAVAFPIHLWVWSRFRRRRKK